MPKVSPAAIRDEMREDIVVVGGGRQIGENYQTMLHRACRALGIPYNRAWQYWYERIKRPPADEFLEFETCAAQHGRNCHTLRNILKGTQA
jgi:hypothetical protein